MSEYILYALAGVIILLIVFLLLRLILQLVFIRQCPECGKTVSLAKTRECPRCGHDFKSQRDPKFHLTVTVLVAAVLGIGAFDVYSFKMKTEAYQANNPYVSVMSITREDEDESATEATGETEMPAESGTEGQPEQPEAQTLEGQPEQPEAQTPEGQPEQPEAQMPEGQPEQQQAQ